MHLIQKITLTGLFIPFLSLSVKAQTFSITGSVNDAKDKTLLPDVTILIETENDSVQITGTVTDTAGLFELAVASGKYKIIASYVGYKKFSQPISVVSNINLGKINLEPTNTLLKSVEVKAEQIKTQQSGDTTSFNAGAYKTNPDANAEDLVTKMPGITSEGGTLKAQGEDVKQVLVDGKPFFGDDPNAALKNLPADVIDKIQVFDKLSDQAQFTGFDDGSGQKTINIITKAGRNNGQFGKLYAGYGTDDRYSAGGNVNYFKGNTRLSVIAMSNNMNQQNFSSDDLLGVVGSSSANTRGGGGTRGSGGGGYRGRGGSEGSRGGTDASNFLVGQQPGITQTHSAGLNYSDNWGKKIKVSGSYFFNYTDNNNINSLNRNYFTSADSNLVYSESSTTLANNSNHRANFRLEYEIDSFNALIISPRLSFQSYNNDRDLEGINKQQDSSVLSHTANLFDAQHTGYNFSNDILFRSKLNRKGRTISVNATTQLNAKTGDGNNYSLNEFVNDTTLLDQQYHLKGDGYMLSGNLTYTEPISAKSQLLLSYSPSYTVNHSNKSTYNNDGNDSYTDYDTLLSNKYNNRYTTHRGGLSYRFNNEKLNLMLGANYQYALLDGQQEFPTDFTVNRTFTNVLPQAMLNIRFTKTSNLRLMYRTNTNAPSISQLQNVVDNSNALLLKTGNPDLKQSFQHTLILRYGNTNVATSKSFFAFVYGSVTNDYVANATYIPNQDTMVNGFIINRGSQLSVPVNLSGYYTARSFLTYSLPIKYIKSNLNISAGLNYSRTPAMINQSLNYANNYGLNGGLSVSSNISEQVDFSIGYNGIYNIVNNSIQTESDNNYFVQNSSAKLNWLFWKGFVFNTSLNYSNYTGLSEGYNQHFFLWNAALGYKFFKDKSLDVRVTAFDILNQNRAIERTVSETYIEDSYTNVLQRYLMLNITYTLRNFKTK